METMYDQKPDTPVRRQGDLDFLLNQVDKTVNQTDFQEKMRKQFQTRYKRSFRVHLYIILICCTSGVILLLPEVFELLMQINLAESGIPVLSGLIEKYQDVENLALLAINGSESVQIGLNNSLSVFGWLGLALISVGCLLGINVMIHRKLS